MTPEVLVPAVLEHDDWLTDRLGRAAWRLGASAVGLDGSEFDAALDSLPGPGLVYAKVPVEDLATAHRLSERGFALVDTNITLERPPFPTGPAVSDCRAARPSDRAAVERLASSSFQCSRFHRDPGIDDRVADGIKIAWAGNFFEGERGDGMVVASDDGEVVGFLLYMLTADRTLVIDLIAVATGHRGRGLAGGLTRSAQHLAGEVQRLRVGTQAVNVAATRAYERLGFRLVGASYVFHLHLDG